MAARDCPFCGFNEGWVTTAPSDESKYVIKCNVCNSYGPPSISRDGAEKKWNGYLKSIDIKNKEKFQSALKESVDIDSLIGKTYKSDDGVDIYFSPDGYVEIIDPETDRWIYQFNKIPEPGETINQEGEIVQEEEIEEGEPYLYYSDFNNYIEIFSDGIVEFTINLDELEELNEDMGGVSSPMSTVNNTPGTGNAAPASSAAMTGSQQGSSSAIGSGDKWDNSMGPYTQDGKKEKEKKKNKKKQQSKKKNESALNPYDEIGKMMAKRMNVPLYFEKGNNSKHVKQKEVEKMGSKGYSYKIATLDDFKKNKKKK